MLLLNSTAFLRLAEASKSAPSRGKTKKPRVGGSLGAGTQCSPG